MQETFDKIKDLNEEENKSIQEKVLYIINLLELSDAQVAKAIGKSKSAVAHKRLNIGFNKFRDEDLKKLIDTYIEKLNKIRKLI